MSCKLNFIRLFVITACMFSSGISAAQDELHKNFFEDANAALAEANKVDAKLFAPRSYDRGTKAYEAAKANLNGDRNAQLLRDKTAEAVNHFSTAKKSSELAKTILSQVLKSRQDAFNASANELSKLAWDKANQDFASAIRYLERGDLKNAKRKDIAATNLYREAELNAIKAQYLNETRRMLEDANKQKVGRYAPFTLNKAKQLLANAERELEQSRYDTDYPRSLAQQANYEAKHAFYLADIVRSVRYKDLTIEKLILQWEEALQHIAEAADIVPTMSHGHKQLRTKLVTYIENTQNELQNLKNELKNLKQDANANNLRIADMEEEIRTLDKQLGGATAERSILVQRLEAQARVTAQFEQVEIMFTKNEARVFREGNNIILRLVGLDFDSGQSTIKQDNFKLLAKVEKAIDIFPRSEIMIEGHTDSYGNDSLNQKLSQSRAESLQKYMIKTMRIRSYRVIATGYGETNPVANNETAAGRAKNRRIDIVIKPKSDPSI